MASPPSSLSSPRTVSAPSTSTSKDAEPAIRSVSSNLSQLSVAYQAAENEHRQTISDALRQHHPAALWCVPFAFVLALKGYSVSQQNSFFLDHNFMTQFGAKQPDGTYLITQGWQAAINYSTTAGQIIGALLSGPLGEKLGYRITPVAVLTALTAFIGVNFAATAVTTVVAGNLLTGLCWEAAHVLALSYIADVAPLKLRAHITTLCNFCWGLGAVVGMGVVTSVADATTNASFRTPYAVQWIWPVPLLVLVALAPESPWWLLRKGKSDDARRSLSRMASSTSTGDCDIDATLALMKHTYALETASSPSALPSLSYAPCFRPVNRRRILLTAGISSLPALSGSDYGAYGPFFLWMGGLPFSTQRRFWIGQHGMTMLGTVIVWAVLMTAIGRRRRPLILTGLAVQPPLMLAVGCLSFAPKQLKYTRAGFAAGLLLTVWWLAFSLALAPLSYTVAAELPPRALLPRTLALARAFAVLLTAVCISLTGAMVNPAALDWDKHAGFFWAGAGILCLAWVFFFLPETGGRSFSQLQVLFAAKTKARRFATASAEVFDRDDGATAGHTELVEVVQVHNLGTKV